MKYRIGADPLAFDTDGDYLLDDFELMHLALTTSVSSADSDGKGISDAYEDPDGDGLLNHEEQTYGTEPLKADTDDDALSDPEEISLGTDPCNPDSDGDGILDGYEVALGTNPADEYSDEDSIPDGEEDYWSTDHYVNETLNMTVYGRGYAIANASVAEVNFTHLMREDVLVSKVYDIGFGDCIDNGTVTIKYNSTFVEDNETLSVYRFDKDLGTFLPINSTVDETQGTVTCAVTNSSMYAVLDSVKWDSLFVNWPGMSSSEVSALGLGWQVVTNGGFSEGQTGWVPSGPYIRNQEYYGMVAEPYYTSGYPSPPSLRIYVRNKGTYYQTGSDYGVTECTVLHPDVDLTNVDLLTFNYKCVASHQGGGVGTSGLRFWIDGVSTAGSPSFRDTYGSGPVQEDSEWQTATINVSQVTGVRTLSFMVAMNRISTDLDDSYQGYLIDDVTAWSETEPSSPNTAVVRLHVEDSQSHAGVPNAKITLSDSGKYVYTDAYGNAYDFLFKGSSGSISYRIEADGYNVHDGYIRIDPDDFGTCRTDKAVINDGLTGSIKVTYTQPQVFIYVDDMYYPGLGNTAYIHDLCAEPGYNSHTVRVEKEGYIAQSQTVVVPAGGQPEVSFNLMDATGAIAVTSTPPGAGVYLDQVYRDTTSESSGILTISNVNPGQHRIDVQKDGYAPFWTMVTVTDGQTAQVDADLDNADEEKDGLLDYYEINGFVDGFGNRHVTDPDSVDTDGDGLSDGYEVTELVHLGGNAFFFKSRSDPTKIDSDEDGINDPDEPEFLTQPMKRDTDSDWILDRCELLLGTDPINRDTDYDGNDDYLELQFDYPYGPLVHADRNYIEDAVALADGFASGEWGADRCDNLYYLAGWMLSGVVLAGDIRDIGGSIVRGDGQGTLMNAIALIPAIGDAEKAVTKGVKFLEKHPEKYYGVAQLVVKIDPSIGSVRKIFGDDVVDGLNGKGFTDDVIVLLAERGVDIKLLNEAMEGQSIYVRYPGFTAFFSDQLRLEGTVFKERVTFNTLNVVRAQKLGQPILPYMNNLQGAYSELCAKLDIGGDAVRDLSHVNTGGVDYAALVDGGNTLKIVEVKARQSLERSDLWNYIKFDQQGNPASFNVNYVTNSLGEDFFKEQSTVSKEFVLYINSPESTAIKNHLNFNPDLRLWYEFTDSDGLSHVGSVKITVTAVNK